MCLFIVWGVEIVDMGGFWELGVDRERGRDGMRSVGFGVGEFEIMGEDIVVVGMKRVVDDWVWRLFGGVNYGGKW